MAVVAGAAVLLVALAPYAFAELIMVAARLETNIMPAPANPAQFRPLPGPAAGTVVDGHWRVEPIAPGTWAIGEPAGDPDNYAYLLVGNRRALLIDSGATRTHDIRRALAPLKAEVAGRVATTVDRSDKWLAQTPQMFRIGALQAALAARAGGGFDGITDEASAMELAGQAPRLVPGSAQNFKVTYPEDFALAEAILRSRT